MEKPEEWCPLGKTDVNGRIILKRFKKWHKAINWIYLAPDRDECQAYVNTVMNFRVH
jgi:hypothetical protein